MALQPYVHVETLDEYAERFKDFAHLERNEEGILFCCLHWKGEACVWSYQTQNAYGELRTAIGHDKETEIIILHLRRTPTGSRSAATPPRSTRSRTGPATTLKNNCNVPDTMNFVENFINDIEVPVITAINGIGQHYEFGLMADICICDPDFYFSDAHFSHNIVPGDGMNFSYRMCLGQRRAAYMAYMEPKIDAQTALQWGLVDEIVAHDELIPALLRDRPGHPQDRPGGLLADPRVRHAALEAVPAGRRARARAGRDVRRAARGHTPQLRQDRRRLHRGPSPAPQVSPLDRGGR